MYPFEIADAVITGVVNGLTYTVLLNDIGEDLLLYISTEYMLPENCVCASPNAA